VLRTNIEPFRHKERSFACCLALLRVVRLINTFHDNNKIDDIATTIMQTRI
jgi:hypothetical protein